MVYTTAFLSGKLFLSKALIHKNARTPNKSTCKIFPKYGGNEIQPASLPSSIGKEDKVKMKSMHKIGAIMYLLFCNTYFFRFLRFKNANATAPPPNNASVTGSGLCVAAGVLSSPPSGVLPKTSPEPPTELDPEEELKELDPLSEPILQPAKRTSAIRHIPITPTFVIIFSPL